MPFATLVTHDEFRGGRLDAQVHAGHRHPKWGFSSGPPTRRLFHGIPSANTTPCTFAGLPSRCSHAVFPSWPTSNLDNKNPARSATHGQNGCLIPSCTLPFPLPNYMTYLEPRQESRTNPFTRQVPRHHSAEYSFRRPVATTSDVLLLVAHEPVVHMKLGSVPFFRGSAAILLLFSAYDAVPAPAQVDEDRACLSSFSSQAPPPPPRPRVRLLDLPSCSTPLPTRSSPRPPLHPLRTSCLSCSSFHLDHTEFVRLLHACQLKPSSVGSYSFAGSLNDTDLDGFMLRRASGCNTRSQHSQHES